MRADEAVTPVAGGWKPCGCGCEKLGARTALECRVLVIRCQGCEHVYRATVPESDRGHTALAVISYDWAAAAFDFARGQWNDGARIPPA